MVRIMKKIIVFDVDGTLFDTQKGIINTFEYVLNVFNVRFDSKQLTSRLIGPPVKTAFIDTFGMSSVEAEEATKIYRQKYVETYIYESEIYEGTKNIILRLLDAGYILGIATMKTQNQIDKLLSIYDINNLFDVVIGAREDGILRKEDMLQNIKQKYKKICNEFYMVGDTEMDYYASQKAGFSFIGAGYGYGCFRDEKKYEIVDNVRDLEKILL